MFDINCRDCSRLAEFMDEVKRKHARYHCRPVAPFGDDDAQLLIVGLAPGMHGANATGRPFTGDYAGELLYKTLFEFGFSSSSESSSRDDGLTLKNCRITNAVKCLPPQNKPTTAEIRICNHFLRDELDTLRANTVILALGTIAHNAVLRAFGMTLSRCKFAHGAQHDMGQGRTLLDSYHCSRYNTQTKRLTPEMFADVFAAARSLIAGPA